MASSTGLADRSEAAESPLRRKLGSLSRTAFRHEPGKRFVLYLGDDKADEGVYKFVSHRAFSGRERPAGSRTLEAGQLFIAHWEPGRSAAEGRGIWVSVPRSALEDTTTKLRELFGAEEYDRHFATGRLADIELAGTEASTSHSSATGTIPSAACASGAATRGPSPSPGVTTRRGARRGAPLRAL